MDRRRYAHKWYESFDSKLMQYEIEIDGELVKVPAKYEVCDTCEGKGKVVNPSIDERGLSAEDFDRDPDFYGDYISGMYDIQCPHCNGLRVSAEPDYDRMETELSNAVQDHIADYYQEQRSDYEVYRMESGGYDY